MRRFSAIIVSYFISVNTGVSK